MSQEAILEMIRQDLRDIRQDIDRLQEATHSKVVKNEGRIAKVETTQSWIVKGVSSIIGLKTAIILYFFKRYYGE